MRPNIKKIVITDNDVIALKNVVENKQTKSRLEISQSISLSCNSDIDVFNYDSIHYNNVFMSSNEPKQLNYSYLNYKKQDKSQQNTKAHIISQNRWTKEEDELLLNIVKKIGPRKWKEISRIIKTKTGKQCRDHYVNCLDPKINNSLWTEEEEKILLLKYEELGPHWSKIQKYLPGRTNLMVKNYINNVLKRNGNNFDKINAYGNDVNFFIDSKKMQKNDFTAIDINYLLNKPIAASELW